MIRINRNAREAARAVAEALPFLEKATKATLLAVDPEARKFETDNAPAADIAKHIGRYGAPVDVSIIESRGRDASDVILDQARRTSADLIVMGGYGHSRAREWLVGGATRNTLTASELSILVAH